MDCGRRSENAQLLLIGSRQCAFHRAIDKPCALPLSPPKGGSHREFLHFALPFIFLLHEIIETSNLVCLFPAYGRQTVLKMGVITSRDPL